MFPGIPNRAPSGQIEETALLENVSKMSFATDGRAAVHNAGLEIHGLPGAGRKWHSPFRQPIQAAAHGKESDQPRDDKITPSSLA